ncbi:MAG: hypothetical protein ABGW76_07470 [Mesonia sp.]|uniref:hypothetical protein n=1 Tax=Mesonia sp. TaxID=1960830 RepID=UPI0032428550
MKKNFCVKVLLGIVFFSCSSAELFAQSLPGFGGDVNDETPAASIDLLLYLGLVAGSFLGAKKLKNNYQSKN